MLLENHDERIQYFQLMLERSAQEPILSYQLPGGYHFAFYREGDEAEWISIEISAHEIQTPEQGKEVFQRYFGQWHAELCSRMVFVLNEDGEKVATGTAWWDIRTPGPSNDGWLHWIAVREDVQGLGIARPLIAFVMQLMKQYGAKRFIVPTQTTTWLACRIYLDMGFRPIPQNIINCPTGWKIIRRLTDHPALAKIEKASLHEMFPALYPVETEETQEHSCGAVIYGLDELHEVRFLLVQSMGGEWGFPKGHVEPGESDLETALREIREETGLSVRLVHGFCRETIYQLRKIGKRVTYFLAEGDTEAEMTINDTQEVRQALWCTPEETDMYLKMEDRKMVFQAALDYMKKRSLI